MVADPMGGPGAPPAAPGASRSTRQTLLAIEALYRGLLRVEDLEEPRAIANALVLKVTITFFSSSHSLIA